MLKLVVPALAGAMLLCAACSPQNSATATAAAPVAATISAAVLPPADLATVQQTCQAAGPLLDAAAAPTMPATVSDTAIPAQAYCQQLAAAPQGQVPATTDSNTPSWLPAVISGVQVAGEVAKVALPLLLTAL